MNMEQNIRLIYLFAVLNVLDALLTVIAIKYFGAFEVNPLMREIITIFGFNIFFCFKTLISLMLVKWVFIISLYSSRILWQFICVVFTGIVLWNTLTILMGSLLQ